MRDKNKNVFRTCKHCEGNFPETDFAWDSEQDEVFHYVCNSCKSHKSARSNRRQEAKRLIEQLFKEHDPQSRRAILERMEDVAERYQTASMNWDKARSANRETCKAPRDQSDIAISIIQLGLRLTSGEKVRDDEIKEVLATL